VRRIAIRAWLGKDPALAMSGFVPPGRPRIGPAVLAADSQAAIDN
jgi:hypothetical protein